ncbi:MAG: BamA/TamA family outer membrane protein, partial [Elusimicrobiota bacterium]
GLDDTPGEIIVRDAATSDGLIPLWKLEHFSHLKPHQVRLAYESGEKVLEFIESEFGEGKVERIIKLFESRFETSAVLSEVVGLDVFKFDKKWQEYAKEKYGRIARLERLKEPTVYGEPLTRAKDDIPQQNITPVFTPDGRQMAYFSTAGGFPVSLMLKDLKTGKVKKLISHDTRVENIHQGNFTNKSRTLAISPDGRTLAFAGTKNHRWFLHLYDLKRRKLRKIPIPGLTTMAGPDFSPDGKRLAFSAMKEGSTDIYVIDLESRKVRQLTRDPQDDQTPAWAPDGKSIVYSSELEVPGDPMLYQRRLRRVRVADGRTSRVLDLPGAARDPVFSRDGKRILFSLERGGFYEVYELELASGKASRMTRSLGAAFTPIYHPSGQIAFAALRRGSIHIYQGDRARFEADSQAGALGGKMSGARIVASAPTPALTNARAARSPFSSDLFLPAFFFSSNGGLFWTSYWQGSDLLGNHQLVSFVSYASGAGFLDYQNVYAYNRRRTKLQLGAIGRYRRGVFDDSTNLTTNEFSHSEFASATYPLDRFNSLNLTVASVVDDFSIQGLDARNIREARQAMAAFQHSTVHGRYLVATEGRRLKTRYLISPEILGGNFLYQSVSAGGVQYVPSGGRSALVLRGVGIRSWGRDTPQFVLGGIGGVRGYARSTVRDVGSRLALATAEWRIPIFSRLDYYMWYIFPDFYFKSISLAFFTDAGYTWDSRGQLRSAQWGELRNSYGVGLRLHTFILQLFPLVLHFDYAQRTTTDGGVFYIYLGPLI